MTQYNFDDFIEKLNSQNTWPSIYLFKFIIKDDAQKTEDILCLFDRDKDKVEIKASAKGTYHSISIHKEAQSAEEIIAIYQSASLIEGVIAL